MLEYIYFVKCPGCEDEHFYFFNDAKECAMSQLTKKPIITQTEVNRNDFGECTDSADLGTVWSWEEVMKATEDEPANCVFTKDDLTCDIDSDPEFTAIDNSLDSFRKPVPGNLTPDDLVEEMEENEDTVECKWCEELFDKSECRYEVDMGWLCDRCQAAIMSRGEPLTFRDGSLEEAAQLTTWACEFDGKYVGTVEAATEDEALDKMQHEYPEYHYGMYDGCYSVEPVNTDVLSEAVDPNDLVELEYPSLTVTLYGEKRDVDDWDEFEHTDSHVFLVPKVEVAVAIWENWITDEDVVDVEGGLETLEDDKAWDDFLKVHFDSLFEKYHKEILEYFREDAEEDFRERAQEEYSIDQWSASVDRAYDAYRDSALLGEAYSPNNTVDFEYNNLEVTLQGPKKDVDVWDELDTIVEYTYTKSAEDVATDIWENFITDYDVKDVPGGMEALEDDAEWQKFLVSHFDNLVDKYYNELLKYYREDARKEYEANHSLGEGCDKPKSFLEELEEPDIYRGRLKPCPECGADAAFDHETGFCINCGFNV